MRLLIPLLLALSLGYYFRGSIDLVGDTVPPGPPPPPVVVSSTLGWDPPTTNSDGTALTDLAGYRLLYRPVQTPPATPTLLETQETQIGVSGLSAGQLYEAWIRAYDSTGNESVDSPTVQWTAE